MINVSTPLPFKQVGADDGRLVFYFHGVPGAPEEIEVFDSVARQNHVRIICLDRFVADASLQGEAYYRHLAKQIERIAGERPVEFIGFSIGGFVAIKTLQYMSKQITHLYLVSAAAPLNSGNDLQMMAGKRVFELVQYSQSVFRLFACVQRLLAFLFPSVLFGVLFLNAAGYDLALSGNPEFQHRMKKVLRNSFRKPIAGYIRELSAYVQHWGACLPAVAVTTSIWHGDADNWSPICMADYFESSITKCTSKHVLAERSHYSCLYEAVPKILFP